MNLFEMGIVLKAFDHSSKALSAVSGSLGRLKEGAKSVSDSMRAMAMSSLSSG